jgi:hypothetical protein
MTRTRLLGLGLVLLLPACRIALPEAPLHEIPAQPMVEKIAALRASFSGMKAVARVVIDRKGRTRAYESVALIQQGYRKLKVEAYGPLGELLVALLWDGNDVIVRKSGDPEPLRVGQFGLERVIGVSIAPADLCSLLSGNVPEVPGDARTRAGCSADGSCSIDLWRDADLRWHVPFVPPAGDGAGSQVVAGADLYRKGRLVLHSSFEPGGWSAAQGLPKRVIIEDPDRKGRVVVEYEEAEANVTVGDSVFVLAPAEEQGK